VRFKSTPLQVRATPRTEHHRRAAHPVRPIRRRDWIATLIMALAIPSSLLLVDRTNAAVPTLDVAATARPGAQLAVRGEHFGSSRRIDLVWDGAHVAARSIRSDRGGVFAASITVPANATDGAHQLTAVRSTGNAARSTRVATGDVVARAQVTVVAATPTVAALSTVPAPAITAAPTPLSTPPPATPAPTLVPTAAPTAVPPPATPPPAPPPPAATSAPTPVPAAPAPTTYTFRDEFDGSGWSAQRWQTPLGEPFAEETLRWSGAQSTVSGGLLHLRATRVAPNQWVSGCLDTVGRFQQRYGWFEARIMVPQGQGLWPAFWAISRNGDGSFGPSEIDMMEILANPDGVVNNGNVGDDVTRLHQVVHYPGGMKWHGVDTVNLSSGFHVYGVEWRPSYIDFYLDGVRTHRYTGPMPSGEMVVVLNLAVGGWPGPSTTATPNNAEMLVDWVRVRP
jgi:beta-glucanase (GH16 family)